MGSNTGITPLNATLLGKLERLRTRKKSYIPLSASETHNPTTNVGTPLRCSVILFLCLQTQMETHKNML